MFMQVGMLVAPVKAEWGVGIVAGVDGDIAHVFFRNQTEKTAKRFRFASIKPADAPTDPWNDKPPRFIEKEGLYTRTKEFESTESARRRFVERFPLGFKDPAYIDGKKTGERAYKMAAVELFATSLGDGKGEAMLAAGDVEQAAKLVKRVVAKVSSLLAKAEQAALNEGLSDTAAARKFLNAFFALAQPASKETFEPYLTALRALPSEETDCGTWTIATVLPSVAWPSSYMYVKPTNIKKASERADTDIHYNVTPSWKTYAAVLKLADTCMTDLAELEPSDYIDVQSYFWVTGEAVSKSAAAKA
ncbi:MAG: hypothetical protein ABIS27_02205 [Longimicrobiales bacterium]